MNDQPQDAGLWEHVVRFDQALKGLTLDLSADEARRATIAQAFGMIELKALTAHIVTTGVTGVKPIVRVRLDLQGEVTQECGVTLEPFTHAISDVLEIECIEKGRVTNEVAEVGAREFSLDDLDEPDVIENGQIDLGQYVIEALGEAYDPFARKPGAIFEAPETEKEPSPFAILATLKKDEPESGH